jgi:hypothetical protein
MVKRMLKQQADDIDTRIGRLSFENGQGAAFDFGD